MELNREQIIKALKIYEDIISPQRCTVCFLAGILKGTCEPLLFKDTIALIEGYEQRIFDLEKKLRYLLQSKTIQEYDEVDIHTKEYVKDIHSLDANIEHLNEWNKELTEKNESLFARNFDLAEKGEQVVIAYKKLSEENERLRAELEKRPPKLVITKLPKKH